MGGFFKTLSIDGVGQFSRYSATLFSLADLIGDEDKMWGELLSDVGDYFIDKILDNYKTAGGEVGGFTKLSPRYAFYFHGGDVTPYLVLSGEYRDAWRWDQYKNESAIIIHNPEFEMTLHLWHEFGVSHDRDGRGELPMRPVLNLTEKDLEFIDKNFEDTFDSKIFRRL